MGMQQMLLGAAGKSETTYVEDVFKINLWTGDDASTRNINAGMDLATDGGLVWLKPRSRSDSHIIGGTGVPNNKYLMINSTSGISTENTSRFKQLTSTGFQIGNSDMVNQSPHTYASWSFKQTDKFFKIVEYSGNSSNPRNIAHGLGCVPGMIVWKDKATGDWDVWHRYTGLAPNNPAKPDGSDWYGLELNDQAARTYDTDSGNPTYTGNWFNFTDPDATNFTVGEKLNESGRDYIAYIFGGGASPASNAKSVHFAGPDDWMNTSTTSDFAFGTGDFTVECWVQFDSDNNNSGIFNIHTGTGIGSTTSIAAAWNGSNWVIYGNGQTNSSTSYMVTVGQWYHVAYVRQSNTVKFYVNGTEVISATDSTDRSANAALAIGAYNDASSYGFDGSISNFRVVKGTAVYTSSFRPPTEPLANITNTKMLCCNTSTNTGKTVGPALTAWGAVTANPKSPFDDPAGFAFGSSEESIIHCGGYIGNADDDGPEIHIGWEPQYVMIKNTGNSGESWHIMDCARGAPVRNGASNSGTGNEKKLFPNSTTSESTGNESISIDARGFKIVNSNNDLNEDGKGMIFIAIRRTDGYVGKPPAAASDVFKVIAGSNSTNPTYASGFQTDFIMRRPAASSSLWVGSSRLTGKNYLRMNDNDSEANLGSSADWSFENGMGSWGSDETSQTSWNWRRHKGFDVVPYNVYSGHADNKQSIPHSLNAVPEMIWVKARTSGGTNDQWAVYHKDLSGTGGHAYNAYLWLTTSAAKADSEYYWVEAPTSTHFTVSTQNGRTGDSSEDYIAYLFASATDADGNPVSKVGTYTGNTSSQPAVNLGFQPSFILIKRASGSDDWNVYDTLRGISQSGDEKRLKLNEDSAQDDQNHISLTSDGFQIESNNDAVGGNNDQYVYYAHK
tara:strand:+ start:106 stop:2799 length:2694 start_codon:yes stop_codon:yes gene_type:complete